MNGGNVTSQDELKSKTKNNMKGIARGKSDYGCGNMASIELLIRFVKIS